MHIDWHLEFSPFAGTRRDLNSTREQLDTTARVGINAEVVADFLINTLVDKHNELYDLSDDFNRKNRNKKGVSKKQFEIKGISMVWEPDGTMGYPTNFPYNKGDCSGNLF